ncbi:SDR family NAD(P)-dependent oxidoreductase [Candidatus Palauibacter sp.]|uniref:SDR family NAD(P)-dependent oxidoreductase n=1 Tax=Candidatus Palauibacter sp. TaxID=3101350 RepID=UPI003B02983B
MADRNGRRTEPIAIIGMACRFPGASSIPDFWRLLEEGGNSVQEGIPGSGVGRWGQIFGDSAVQSDGCRFGAFVDDIDQFDDAFFRISPVEAELLDPQQRMMLETSWEALEDAGIDPDGLRETLTGVYTGISNDEYRMLVVDSSKPAEAASCLYALSGTNLNGTSGRVSFVLGLRGPAKAVDAACASSMVSVHDAVADLQRGRADLAIAGGVQAILNGRIYELRADAMMLSPDGQCKTFDASANGYVRGEGCGVVVLKRLSEAAADGDRIWAVIRGSAVNHGGASTGLTVPHTPALEEVMHAALADAGVSPLEVDYLEAHGTGTTVGDPIEANAVVAVYGKGRNADNPLLMGSVKTNIGHLESAAGVAGVIKAALVLNRGVIPKHLHFNDPNPSLDWDRLPLRVTSSMMEWPGDARHPRRAGVNSFGISGTNAHLVMEEYRAASGAADREADGAADRARSDGDWAAGAGLPVEVSMPATVADVPVPEGVGPRAARLLPLSGKSEGALRDLAGRYVAWLDEHGENPSAGDVASDLASDLVPDLASSPLLADMAWTAGVGRSHFDHRAGVIFRDAASLRERLLALAARGDGAADGGAPDGTPARVAFAYTGQGSQWAGMGEAIYESEPVARAVLDRCEAVFVEERGASLLDVMFGRPDRAGGRTGARTGDLGDTAWEQPALYALECALTALWASLGVRPDVVIGHSIGELAASQAAGVFSLEDGMRFAAARGALMSRMEEGGMAAVFATPEQVASAVEAVNEAASGVGLSISGYNGTHQVVSGPVADIEAISKRFEGEGVRVRRLNTKRAFHSALVDPILDELAASLDGAAIEAPSLTVVSNLTGRAVEAGQALDGTYWRGHAREPVAFAQGVQTLADLGVDLVLEIGPRSLLAPMAASAWPESPQPPAPAVLSSLTAPAADGSAAGGSGSEDAPGFTEAVAAAYEAGLPVRFAGLFAGETRRRIALPSYPFQRVRHWVAPPKRRRGSDGHPLLGARHESARGEITFETEVFPSDPAWMDDHRVFGRVVAPGALYGAMTIAASVLEEGGSVVVEEMQLHNPLVFDADGDETEGETDAAGRTLQVVLDAPDPTAPRGVQIFSRGSEGVWTVHVEGRLAVGVSDPEDGGRIDLESLRADLSPVEVADYYRHRASTGVDLGPPFRTLGRAWFGPGEAVAEVSLPETMAGHGLDVHPLVLDGCFQAVGVARNVSETEGGATYLPFGWERLWLAGQLPDRVVCHVRLSEASRDAEAAGGEPAEVLSCELRIYDPDGAPLGRLSGYTVKRATRQALLSAVEGIKDLLYEVAWRERALPKGVDPADFFPSPAAVAEGAQLFAGYLTDAGVDPDNRNALLADLERWSHARALQTLEDLGWRRTAGETVDPERLRQELDVLPEHGRLFRRMFEMLAWSGVAEETADGFRVLVGPDDPLPEHLLRDLDEFAIEMTSLYSHGLTEVGLFRRSGLALADVLRGGEDPLTLLFSSGEPTAADLYLKAPVARAANEMLTEAVRTLVAALPEGRRLRVIEVGAGTGSATASVLPELPAGRFEYMYTDISAGFFAEAEARFGDGGGCIEYRPLDIEKDPIAQGFDAHGYDLMIASNVLHATRYLEETLGHCRELMAPSGQLVALENLTGLGWMDLTFGQLDGWWRFADDYRPHHALAGPSVWRQALGDAGFEAVEVLGVDESDPDTKLDKGVIVAQGPARVTEPAGAWVLAADDGGTAEKLAAEMRERNQTVVLASAKDAGEREAWRSLIASLPEEIPFNGAVHLAALDGHGERATTDQMASDIEGAVASALALVQGVGDSDLTPEKGVWFITRGAQILERERGGELAGAALWGFGKGVAREAAHLQPRLLDLDPASMAPEPDLVNELLYPDPENHIAYRRGSRQVARLVRMGSGAERLEFPDETEWVLAPDPEGVFDRPYVQPLPARLLEPREVRVAVEASGLNFWDVFRSLGFIEEGLLGREMCGHILEVGSDVTSVAVGDHIVGLGFGAFGPQMITHEELVASAPEGFSVSGLATIPSAYVSAALSFELSGLEAGERVLVHAGAGGVGLAAIQLVQAAGAEVFATASAPKQAYLRSLGVEHVFDSRTTDFGEEILEATGGEGVDVVLNSLTSEGFIDASLDCLRQGGRFVEMARRDILTEEEMAAVRPDVGYWILELDVLKKTDPAWVGRVLRDLLARLSTGELEPIIHSRWPLAEAGAALSFMRSARHLGKIVVTTPPLVRGGLRGDRSYLVTGGLGGIGIAVADWLAERGAGAIVLNGRRNPDPEAAEAIRALRQRGVTVQVELADMTDQGAIDGMMERIERDLPPLGGVIHSVGVLSDGALPNQNWECFERVLWPKILGAWHLHRATIDRDLDFFTLFSSRVGVMGNPGQANHASANAFLDQLAGHRRALGLPGQAIAWGAWSDIGEAAEQRDRIDRQRSALGGRWFTPQQGMRAFDRLVRQDATTSVVMSMDWDVFEEAVEDPPPMLEDLLSAASEARAADDASSEDVLTRLRGTLAAERENLLVSYVQGEVQAVLRLSSAPAPTVGFFDLGMDSLMAVELRNRMNRAFSGTYTAPNTLVFDYPNIAELAAHLAEELGEGGEAPAPAPEPAPEARVQPPEREPDGGVADDGMVDDRTVDDGVAIIGMACRFPGAPDLAAFWRQLEAGIDAVTDGRRDAGPWHGVAGDPASEDHYSRRGAFLEDIDKFDARFFGITPIEARMMDPRQRLLLETTWHALEDAGLDSARLKGTNTGVYAGVTTGDYRDLAAAMGHGHGYLGTTMSVTAGRISFALGLTGPAVPLDMACASSLVAVHQAAAAVRQGEVELALVGGVNAIVWPETTTFMKDVGMLSSSGLCHTFDAAADGFVRGEGCGMVVLKRLADAKADGDRIWGVVRGSSVNQNGASAGLTVPNGPAQERVIEQALAQAGVPAASVDYLEAHGAGSDLGDPIEVQAAAAVYGRGRDEERPLLIGSVKTNIGHLECAAGVASLIKAVFAMNEGRIPKQLHFHNPNPHLAWDELPVRVTDETVEWPSNGDRPPRAGVSSFGISGTNAHVVVEGNGGPGRASILHGAPMPAGPAVAVPIALPESEVWSPPAVDVASRETRLLPLSAKSPRALRELARRYLEWLDGHGGEASEETPEESDAGSSVLADMAWTAGVGRTHLAHRAGLVFRDVTSLRGELNVLAARTVKDEWRRDAGPGTAPKVAFFFAGEDGVRDGSGDGSDEDLYKREPVVRAVLDRCDAVLKEERDGVSLLDVMFGPGGAQGALRDPEWAQPAAYALGCALTSLWASAGIRPGAVAGHGAGELAAGWAAGVFGLDDGLRLAAARGAAMARPRQRLAAAVPGEGAGDTPRDPLEGLEAAAEEMELSPPSVAIVSQVTGRRMDPARAPDGAYWREQARAHGDPGRTSRALAEFGADLVVDIGTAEMPFAESVARAYEAGFPVSFAGLFAGETRRRIALPGYPFQRRRHWIETRT